MSDFYYRKPHFSLNKGQLTRYSLHAWVGYNLLRFRKTTPHVSVSSFVYSTRGIGFPLEWNWYEKEKDNKRMKHTVYKLLLNHENTFDVHDKLDLWNPIQEKRKFWKMISRDLTGWSASKSAPYKRTLTEHWSRSVIRRGNQGVSSTKIQKKDQNIIISFNEITSKKKQIHFLHCFFLEPFPFLCFLKFNCILFST